ncbi:MAG TPA: pyruvate, phosphate dikinase, partial [Chromatiales bacterium]|nr:pyruvate, phosphate dikinase [Chromatiales bacterium]HEX23278.1 pyruvate, phosphate dikinase [Chromatiales bacterium]
NALLAGAGDITSTDHGYRLQDLAALVETDSAAQLFFNTEPFVPNRWQSLPESSAFKQAFQAFIDEYGHRAVYEVYLNNPRWRENPDYLLKVIKQSIGSPSPSVLKAQQKEKAKQAWQSIEKQIPLYRRVVIKSLVKQAAAGAASKEMAKSVYIRLFEPLRRLFLQAGRRLESRGLLQRNDEIFHCAYIEVTSMLTGDWNGSGLMPLIHSPEQDITLRPGDVLAAPSTDPAWTPLFLNAVAIVMETGGQLSHGAIVAREYGIPAVVNIPGLLNVIRDGEQVVVDGARGIVERCG